MNGVSLGGDMAYLLLISGALFVHACYQLSVSVLTYMSSHTLGRQASNNRLLLLGVSYSFGVIATIALLLLGLVSLTTIGGDQYHSDALRMFTAFAVALLPIVGLATVVLYYRRGQGTQLWLPRSIASYLLKRSRKARSGVEAGLLGAATAAGELPFVIAPLVIIALVIAELPTGTWLGWSTAYAFVASLPLLIVTGYLTSGHSVARVQRWREQNKKFMQWTSGTMLILLTLYLTALQLGAIS